MANYEEARVKLRNTQLKSAAKNKTEIILRITKKDFQGEEWRHELFLTTREKTKIRNDFASNMWVDIKLSKAQFSKIIQLGGFLGKMLVHLGKKGIIMPCCYFD